MALQIFQKGILFVMFVRNLEKVDNILDVLFVIKEVEINFIF